jgi:hypothetical protein
MRNTLTIWLAVVILIGAACVDAAPNVTSYSEMRKELQNDVTRSPLIKTAVIGKASSGKRELVLVRCAAVPTDTRKTVRILVLCRQHGDEPASTEAVLHLLARLAQGSDRELQSELSSVTLYIIPMVNPDGADANRRENGASADLNRDWGVFSQAETRAVADAVKIIKPHLIVDAHNWDGGDPYDANCIEVALADQRGWPWSAPVVPGGNLVTEAPSSVHFAAWTQSGDDPRVTAVRELQWEAVKALDGIGFDMHSTGFGPANDPTLAHRYFMSRGILSMLVETHAGAPSDEADFERRQGMYTALVHFLVRSMATAGSGGLAELDKLEGYGARSEKGAQTRLGDPDRQGRLYYDRMAGRLLSLDAALFDPPPAVPDPPAAVPHPTPHTMWLIPIAALVFILIAGRTIRLRPGADLDDTFDRPFRLKSASEAHCYTGTEPTAESSQANGWRSACRHGKRRCRY